MLSLTDRAAAVLAEAWRMLPPLKHCIALAHIGLEDLGAQHGSYNPETRHLVLSTRLLEGPAHTLPLIDANGNDPPQGTPCIGRGLHTACHELSHALGAATGLDETPEWLRLSSWAHDEESTPHGTARYWERRPGWGTMASPWRYRVGCWFPREYSTKSPHEDFADCVTHVALGWHDFFMTANGLAKLAYIRRHVWEQRGLQTMSAARERWRGRLGTAPIRRKKVFHLTAQSFTDIFNEAEAAIAEAVQEENDRQQAALLLAMQAGERDPASLITAEARQAMTLAIGPALVALYRKRWAASAERLQIPFTETPDFPDAQIDAVLRAATSYTETTQRLLTEQFPVDTRETMPLVEAQHRVEAVFERSTMVRARQVAETEARRMAEAAKVAAWQAAGIAYGVWRTHSQQPCEHCAALHGQRVRLGEAFAHLGDVLRGASGKTMTVTYADVYHPGLHVNCACTIEQE